MSKMVLVEKGKFVIIRDGSGEEIGFSSFEEFLKYCPIQEFGFDPTGKYYADYEPDRDLHIEIQQGSAVAVNQEKDQEGKVVTVSSYEALIANVSTIKARVIDPLYGQDLPTAKETKIKLLRQEATAKILEGSSLPELIVAGSPAVKGIADSLAAAISEVNVALSVEALKTISVK